MSTQTTMTAQKITFGNVLHHLSIPSDKHGQIDLALCEMEGVTHLIQVVAGKWTGLFTGDKAVANYESVMAKAPSVVVHK